MNWYRKIKHWFFTILFPEEYEHLRHLIDDVIRLELDKDTTTGSNCKTVSLEEEEEDGENSNNKLSSIGKYEPSDPDVY